ncbi:hypothetical protein [Pseudaminobacter sp. NGMCC 1.201702]|uniref:hypothetical protein n=1 Tax=Pseudaminobacter sp. NGMCC 1.201702 TaxID=3391825 RepID=UPI0039F0204E
MTIMLIDHDEIRNWAAARMGAPAIVDMSTEGGTQPLLRLVFDQAAYQDQDQGERPQNAGGYELVEWDEWFEIFEKKGLALLVENESAGIFDSAHEFVRRTQTEPGPAGAGESGAMDEDVKYLAENTDLSPNQARDLIRKYGRDRKILIEKARTRKAEG